MTRGVAQLASALEWGSSGWQFESAHPDQSMKSKKILFVGAMDREIFSLQAYFSCKENKKIHGIYPLFIAKNKDIHIGVLQTHVGDTNAALATPEAIKIFNPDYIFKIGCVGGNSEGVHSGDIIIPVGFFS